MPERLADALDRLRESELPLDGWRLTLKEAAAALRAPTIAAEERCESCL